MVGILLMKRRTISARTAQNALKFKSYKRQKEVTVTWCCEPVNYLLENATDKIVAEMYPIMVHLTQPSSSSTEYFEALWNEAQ